MTHAKKKQTKGKKGQKPKKGGAKKGGGQKGGAGQGAAQKKRAQSAKKTSRSKKVQAVALEIAAPAALLEPARPLPEEKLPAAETQPVPAAIEPSAPLVPVPQAPPPSVMARRPLTPTIPASAPSPTKTWRVLGALVLLAALTYAVPGLARFRPWRAGVFEGVLRPRVHVVVWRGEDGALEAPSLRPLSAGGPDLEGALRLALTPSSEGPLAPGEYPYREARAGTLSAIFGAADIEDPTGAMAHFYESLARTKALAPGGTTRIVHLGDSPIVGDLISGGARERLQKTFGDAGHGWTMPARPWDWYYHYGMTLDARGWTARSPLFGNGGRCGLNGVCFTSASTSAWSRVSSASRGQGSMVSHFWVYYGMGPGAGTLEATVDGGDPIPISTSGAAHAPAVRDIPVPEGRHTLTLRPAGDGEVTLYGVALERDVPGVVYDSVGTSGGTVRFLTLLDDRDWEESLRLRKPDLVILNFGTNESAWEGLGMGTYSADLREVVARLRRAVPQASLLIMAPMDRGTRDASGRIVTIPNIPKIVAAQRAVAQETGCAFFDTYQAMGGEGTAARWYQRESPLITGDLTHPTNAGADVVSKLLVDALQKGFDQHAAAQFDR
jgi:lysophospholipase L1-like esterase